MDEKEVLTRFKNGHLDRAQVAALLTGTGVGTGTGGGSAGRGATATGGTGAAPVAFPRPGAGPELAVDGPSPAAVRPAPGSAGAPPAEPIAVVGMAGRYPGSPDLPAFWRRVCEGKDGTSVPPAGRPGDEPGHYLERVQDFDAQFFGIDPHEAALMDPQERLFLETAWEALEDAGCTGSRLDALTAADGTARSVGVFTGAGTGDYALLAARTWTREGHRQLPGGGHGSLPNRFSSLVGLTGPSQSVDTAESSVLVALHLAVAALRAGECAAALVGGVRLLLHPSSRSPGAGEGVGALLLKPLARAVADGDTVHGVIRGSAVGHTAPQPSGAGPGRRPRVAGGRADAAARAARALREACAAPGTSLAPIAPTAPTVPADASEQRVLRAALKAAGVDAATVAVSDDAASVRPLVGAAGAATGVAVLTRALLQLRHRVLAPGGVRAEAQAWEGERGEPRRMSVGVCGAGGAAAHVILEEYVPDIAAAAAAAAAADAERSPAARELFVLSAPTPAHLAATAGRFADLLTGAAPVPPLAVLARALRTGRAAMDCRFAVVVGDTGELVRALEQFAADAAPCADLRDGGADPLDLGGVPETGDYLAALWRAGHLDQVRGLWLSGLDVDWAELERADGAGTVTVPLPASAFLRTPLWLGGEKGPA